MKIEKLFQTIGDKWMKRRLHHRAAMMEMFLRFPKALDNFCPDLKYKVYRRGTTVYVQALKKTLEIEFTKENYLASESKHLSNQFLIFIEEVQFLEWKKDQNTLNTPSRQVPPSVTRAPSIPYVEKKQESPSIELER